MTHAIRIHKTGGPEVLSWEDVQLGKPGPGEARIRHTAVGLNFVDSQISGANCMPRRLRQSASARCNRCSVTK
jgi:NADPH:quinone reductase-like Zn-dependent oxidoreductase